MYLNRNQLKDAYLQDKNIRTDKVVVVSMRNNKQLKTLTKLLDYLNYATNYHFNRYFLKKKSKRIGFYNNNEDAFNNTHSHIYLDTANYDFDEVVKVMKTEWLKLDRVFDKDLNRYVQKLNPTFDLYVKDAHSESAYATYSVKDFNNDDEYTFVPI